MSGNPLLASEREATLVTRFTIAPVNTLMILQGVDVLESFVANLALIFPLIRVDALMSLEIGVLVEEGATGATLKWLSGCVDDLVILEIFFGTEGFLADGTCVILDSLVAFCVVLQAGFGPELFPALVTMPWPLVVVHTLVLLKMPPSEKIDCLLQIIIPFFAQMRSDQLHLIYTSISRIFV